MLTFPQSTQVNQRIPLEELKRQKVDRKIVEQIKAVEWAYKLAPSTLNLAATETIKEVTVLRITLREGVDSWRQRAVVFSALDAAIRSPLIFLVFDESGDALGVALNLKASSGTVSGDSLLFRLFYTENEVTLPSGVTTLESFTFTLRHQSADFPFAQVKPFVRSMSAIIFFNRFVMRAINSPNASETNNN